MNLYIPYSYYVLLSLPLVTGDSESINDGGNAIDIMVMLLIRREILRLIKMASILALPLAVDVTYVLGLTDTRSCT